MPDTQTTEVQDQTAGEAGTSAKSETTGNGGTATPETAGQKTDEARFTQADLDRAIRRRLDEEKARQQRAQEAAEAERKGDYDKVLRQREAENAELLVRLQAESLRAEVALRAPVHRFHNPTTALNLIRDRVEWNEDGTPANVDALLKQLAKDEPYLVKSEDDKPASGLAPNTGRRPAADAASSSEKLKQDLRGRGEYRV